jgi:hypothetical protein
MDHYDIGGYVGLKDYELLADLSRIQSVICIVDYEPGLRDVARTFYRAKDQEERWSVSARGISYIEAFSCDEFLAACAHRNLEFIEPSKPAKQAEPSA